MHSPTHMGKITDADSEPCVRSLTPHMTCLLQLLPFQHIRCLFHTHTVHPPTAYIHTAQMFFQVLSLFSRIFLVVLLRFSGAVLCLLQVLCLSQLHRLLIVVLLSVLFKNSYRETCKIFFNPQFIHLKVLLVQF